MHSWKVCYPSQILYRTKCIERQLAKQGTSIAKQGTSIAKQGTSIAKQGTSKFNQGSLEGLYNILLPVEPEER
jgi:hypothetical protein